MYVHIYRYVQRERERERRASVVCFEVLKDCTLTDMCHDTFDERSFSVI